MTPDLLEQGAKRVEERMAALEGKDGKTESGGRAAGFSRISTPGEVDITHGRILYLEDVSVSFFLARRGFAVEGVDYSQAAIDWARERVEAAGAQVLLRLESVFDLDLAPGSHDLVYDSGCFHHIAPHRRQLYVERVARALKPGGWFGLTCFRPEGGSGYSDEQVYERRTLGGGLGYTEARLREIWSAHLQVRVVRQMVKPSAGSGRFGEPFLWALLAQKA